MLHRIRIALFSVVFILGLVLRGSSQPLRTSTEPGVWSKNTELLAPLNWNGQDPVRTQTINGTHYLVSTAATRYVSGISTSPYSA